MGMTHMRTSPYYPQSDGKQECRRATLKRERIRPQTPLSLEDAQRIVANFVERYNPVRLHSAIGCVTALDKLEGRAEAILAERERKLQAARERRARMRRSSSENLTGRRPGSKLPAAGETESRSEERDRDSRSGRRAFVLGVYSKYPPSRSPAAAKAQSPLMPLKTPGAGAEPQGFVNAKTPEGPESLASVRHLSISR
jgi:hypothetical protein